MKTISISTFATPWLASLRSSRTVVPTGAERSLTAPIAPMTLGLTADGPAKLRQEKTARVQAALGSDAFAYGDTAMVTVHPIAFERQAGDPLTTSTANGGVQGPPPWRQPVTT
ncbi:hypothetical protein AB0O34_13775 [Sphaerisporangium sp. NPDC088356]|uniref:hypothetical protein n=1 Tax=Sphaerisporangium sp. NPDC088356 TaxID=3154871 RepID=UPI00342AE91B